TTTTKDPVVSTKDPVVTTKDPVVSTKDPVVTPKDPVVDPVKPAVTVSAALSADLMAKSSGRTKSSKTKMGTWFDKAVNVTISDADKKFLADATQNVPVPDNKKSEWSYKKFTAKLYPSAGLPHPADGAQASLGDCNMLAFLNSFAYQHPSFLKSIIKDRGNGTYDIAMFDPKAQAITVSVDSNFIADKSGNLIVARGANNTAVWLTVMEKAIMKYNQVYKIWDGDGPAKVEGFGSEAGAPMLTGEGDSYSFDRGALAKSSDLTRVVKEALKAGKLITGGFGQEMTMNGLKSVTGHAYTVMVPPNDSTMIAMRNPWGFSPKSDGGGDSSHDGILDIAFNDAWFKTIDLRVMEPGIAGGSGNTGPYQPRTSFQASGFTADDMEFLIEMHKGQY
ncbi:MAG: hypothetical protein EOP07_13935, partial [Proteobacteria bacterium]